MTSYVHFCGFTFTYRKQMLSTRCYPVLSLHAVGAHGSEAPQMAANTARLALPLLSFPFLPTAVMCHCTAEQLRLSWFLEKVLLIYEKSISIASLARKVSFCRTKWWDILMTWCLAGPSRITAGGNHGDHGQGASRAQLRCA